MEKSHKDNLQISEIMLLFVLCVCVFFFLFFFLFFFVFFSKYGYLMKRSVSNHFSYIVVYHIQILFLVFSI